MAETREGFLAEIESRTEAIAKLTSDHRAAMERVKRARVAYDKAELAFRAEFPPRTLADEVHAQAEVDRRRKLGEPGYVPRPFVPGPSAVDRYAASTTGGNLRGRASEANFRRGAYPATAQNRVIPKLKLPSER